MDQYINGTGEGQIIEANTPAARSLIGAKEDRTRPQCSYDCLLLQECVAISWRADLTDDKDLLKTGTCFLFKQVLWKKMSECQTKAGNLEWLNV